MRVVPARNPQGIHSSMLAHKWDRKELSIHHRKAEHATRTEDGPIYLMQSPVDAGRPGTQSSPYPLLHARAQMGPQ